MRQTCKKLKVDAEYRQLLGIPFGQDTPHFSTFSKNYEKRFKNSDIFEEIFELKEENINLKSLLEKLKDKFYFIKHFIITKILDYKEKDKYVQLTSDLYEHRCLDEDDYKELINFSKLINSSRDYKEKNKR